MKKINGKTGRAIGAKRDEKGETDHEQKKVLAAAGILLAIGAAVFLSLTVGRQLLRLARQPEAFRAWIDGCGPWAPLCLIGLMCFQVVVAVLPGEPIEIGRGCLWRRQGWAQCPIGAALGSTIIFLFTKSWA